jgi:3-oxoacid CoA-transferase
LISRFLNLKPFFI